MYNGIKSLEKRGEKFKDNCNYAKIFEMDRGKKMVEILQILDRNAGLRCFCWIKVAKIILLK